MIIAGILALTIILGISAWLIVSKAGKKDGICKYDQDEE